MKDVYDFMFINIVYKLLLVLFDYFYLGQVMFVLLVRVQYEFEEIFRLLVNQLGIMNDIKVGVSRMVYLGVVSFMYKNLRVYLVLFRNWNGYEYYE